jgi:hypothetical protein
VGTFENVQMVQPHLKGARSDQAESVTLEQARHRGRLEAVVLMKADSGYEPQSLKNVQNVVHLGRGNRDDDSSALSEGMCTYVRHSAQLRLGDVLKHREHGDHIESAFSHDLLAECPGNQPVSRPLDGAAKRRVDPHAVRHARSEIMKQRSIEATDVEYSIAQLDERFGLRESPPAK